MSIARLVTCLLLVQFSSSSPLNSTWINNDSLNYTSSFLGFNYTLSFSDGSRVRPILLKGSSGPVPACGFVCNGTCDGYLFSVFFLLLDNYNIPLSDSSPQVVWSANRNRMVRENATLELTQDGNLILTDADGTEVWSTNTSGKGVMGLALQESANLVLEVESNKTAWRSFDHPTDVILLGQVLTVGMKLVASVSPSNYTEGPYYLSMEKDGLSLYASAPEPQRYDNLIQRYYYIMPGDFGYAEYRNGSIRFVSSYSQDTFSLPIRASRSLQYLKMDPDGGLRVYTVSADQTWIVRFDFLANDVSSQCDVPSFCGQYGLCTVGAKSPCSCLQDSDGNSSLSTDSFIPVNHRDPSKGCVPSYPLLCGSRNSSRDHHFLQIDDVDYFAIEYVNPNVSISECKRICSQNCSCKAAFFLTTSNESYLPDSTYCSTITEVYTLRTATSWAYSSVALIKLQNVSVPPLSSVSTSVPPSIFGVPGVAASTFAVPKIKKSRTPIVAGTAAAVSSVISLLILGCFYKRKRSRGDAQDDAFLKSVPGLPTRFSFRDLRNATDNFRNRLGSGGFGSVFLGVLRDGAAVAVKRLESARQGQKEFRTEVCTIGSIHHLNLVRLCGFCAEGEHRLLVYEFMPNGSLDRWLFSTEDGFLLDWSTRFSIALGTANGLSYLHKDCRERIIHLDVKPQNILLDEHFVAKVSDFGLSKLMDRDQSHVVTTMRGTPGYLAPEWLHSTVTEKADVYSFGIVLLEIVSGRRCLYASNADSQTAYLPVWACLKAEERKLMELVDGRLGEDFDEEEAERVMKVAFWCLQGDVAERPSMGSVVQMLEGVIELAPPPLSFPHLASAQPRVAAATCGSRAYGTDVGSFGSEAPLASMVSAPR